MGRPAGVVMRILVVGVIPPPLGGEALMTSEMLGHAYPDVDLAFVDRLLTRVMNDMERITLRKVVRLAAVIARIGLVAAVRRPHVLYYSPSGASRQPVMRDMVILTATRWMFRRTVFHFHAAGLGEIYPTLSPPLRWVFRRAFFVPDVAVKTSPIAPDDPGLVRARHQAVVPNGVPDQAHGVDIRGSRAAEPYPVVLFVGSLRESKGVSVLLQAAGMMAAAGTQFRLRLMGEFISDAYRDLCLRAIAAAGINDRVDLLGPLTGTAKAETFARASILCLPSHFEAESSPLVLMEAMSFGLPVVATDWRGIPDLVGDGVTGLLVPPRDAAALAGALQRLLADQSLRDRMGAAGRASYDRRHSLVAFHEGTARVFELVRPPR